MYLTQRQMKMIGVLDGVLDGPQAVIGDRRRRVSPSMDGEDADPFTHEWKLSKYSDDYRGQGEGETASHGGSGYADEEEGVHGTLGVPVEIVNHEAQRAELFFVGLEPPEDDASSSTLTGGRRRSARKPKEKKTISPMGDVDCCGARVSVSSHVGHEFLARLEDGTERKLKVPGFSEVFGGERTQGGPVVLVIGEARDWDFGEDWEEAMSRQKATSRGEEARSRREDTSRREAHVEAGGDVQAEDL